MANGKTKPNAEDAEDAEDRNAKCKMQDNFFAADERRSTQIREEP
jgi:hypothetical protein